MSGQQQFDVFLSHNSASGCSLNLLSTKYRSLIVGLTRLGGQHE